MSSSTAQRAPGDGDGRALDGANRGTAAGPVGLDAVLRPRRLQQLAPVQLVRDAQVVKGRVHAGAVVVREFFDERAVDAVVLHRRAVGLVRIAQAFDVLAHLARRGAGAALSGNKTPRKQASRR